MGGERERDKINDLMEGFMQAQLMGQSNMNSTNEMSNLEHNQQTPLHTHPDPCILSGSISNYPQPSMNRMLPVADPTAGFVPHHLSLGSCENPIPYGMTQYNAVHHHPLAGNFVPVTTSSYYNPYMNQGPQFIDVYGDAYKGKSTIDNMAGPSSEVPIVMEVGSQRSVRLGPVGGENMLAHTPNHMIQGNYQGQAMVPANGPWLDQRFSANGGNGATWAWSPVPGIPYIQGAGNMVPERYQETAVHRSSINFQPYPPSMYPQGHPQSLHPQLQPIQGPFYSQVPGPSYRPLRNNSSHANINPFQVSTEVGPRYVRPVPPQGFVVYPPAQGRALVPGVPMRPHPLPHLTLLPADEVAMLEVPGYYEMGNAIDRHRDMRMDVDSMTYEELLALEEHMGYVGTGLSENTISSDLETKIYISSSTSSDLDDRETDFCSICQTNYKNQEEIGTLDCGHEYHVDCIKRWLVLKNICPICKSSALTTKRKDSEREV